jgi:hypothetical protein
LADPEYGAILSFGFRLVPSLIDTPNRFSVLSGVVGVVSLTEAWSATFVGVFISVTTIPAAAAPTTNRRLMA